MGVGSTYYVAWDGTTRAIAAKPQFGIVAVKGIAEDKSILDASPVPSRGKILIRSDRFLCCAGKK